MIYRNKVMYLAAISGLASGMILSIDKVIALSSQKETYAQPLGILLMEMVVSGASLSNIAITFLYFIPFFIFTFCFAHRLSIDFHITGVYVFTRTKNRNFWFAIKMIELVICAFLYLTCYYIGNIVLFLSFGYKVINISDIIHATIILYLLCFPFYLFFIILTNWTVLKTGHVTGGIITVGLTTFFIITAIVMAQYLDIRFVRILWMMNPVCNYMYTWHFGTDNAMKTAAHNINSFSIVFSAGYWLTSLSIIILLLGRFVGRTDFCLENKDHE